MPGVGLARFTGLFADPFLATLAWDLDSLGRLTPDPGRQGLGAERYIQLPHSHTDNGTYNWAGSFGHYGKSRRYTHSLFP